LLQKVGEEQAALVTQWMLVGLINGVINTDNMAIPGEMIDYGPCALMDVFTPATVFSSIAFGVPTASGNSTSSAQRNLARLAEALLPLIDDDSKQAIALATKVVDAFPPRFEAAIEVGWCHKIGLPEATPEDIALALDLLRLMTEHQADFTLTFRRLSDE